MKSTHLCLPRLSRTVDWPPSLSRGSVEESRCALGWSRWLLGYTQSKYFMLGCTDRGGLPSTAEQNSDGRQLITGRRCRVVVVFSPRSLCFLVLFHIIPRRRSASAIQTSRSSTAKTLKSHTCVLKLRRAAANVEIVLEFRKTQLKTHYWLSTSNRLTGNQHWRVKTNICLSYFLSLLIIVNFLQSARI